MKAEKSIFRVLVLGSSGSLGNKIYNELKKNKNIQLFHSGLNKRKLDFSNKLNLKKFILSLNPNLIINCIANTNIENCEKNKLVSKKINYKIVKEILNLKNYKNFDFNFIHFSTDQFYNNKFNKLNKENSKIFLNNNYCAHKRMAEIECLKKNCLVFRTNFFGKSLKNKSFSDWVHDSFKKRNKAPVLLFNDVYFNPLRITTIAKIISLIIIDKKYKYKGIYNLGSKEGMSKSKFALTFAKKTMVYNSNYKFIHANDLLKTKRSNNMIMDVSKFENKFQISLPNIFQEIKNEARYYFLK